MLGRSHALSGAAVWLSGCAAATSVGVVVPPVAVVAGAVVSAGAALLPDLDHLEATAARSLGPVTGGVAWLVSRISDTVRDRTCGCCATATRSGHRTLTHTAVFAVALGAVAAVLGALAGRTAVAVVAGLLAALGTVGLTRGRWRRLAIPAGLAAAGAVTAAPAAGSWWWLGAAVTVGCVTHSLGDGLTLSGVPLLWPARIRGCRWFACRPPRGLRFRTGGVVERWAVTPALWVVLAGSVWLLR